MDYGPVCLSLACFLHISLCSTSFQLSSNSDGAPYSPSSIFAVAVWFVKSMFQRDIAAHLKVAVSLYIGLLQSSYRYCK